MKHLNLGRINEQHVRLLWTLISLALLVLGSSAPSGGGGIGSG